MAGIKISDDFDDPLLDHFIFPWVKTLNRESDFFSSKLCPPVCYTLPFPVKT